VVVREMLLAGVRPDGLRRFLVGAQIHGARSREAARGDGLFSAAAAFLGVAAFVRRREDRRDPDAMETALLELEAWEARAGLSRTPN
jgi:hypothetical protein